MADGLTNRDIANRLFISERTVDGHLEHIREKLEVNTRAQVAAWVVRQESGNSPSAAVATPASRAIARPRLVAHPRMWTAAALVLALLAAGVGVLRLTDPPPLTVHTIAGIQATKNGQDGDYTGDGNRAIHAALVQGLEAAGLPAAAAGPSGGAHNGRRRRRSCCS